MRAWQRFQAEARDDPIEAFIQVLFCALGAIIVGLVVFGLIAAAVTATWPPLIVAGVVVLILLAAWVIVQVARR